MIQCVPKGICSWNYELRGSTENALIEFNWPTEQGRISIAQTEYKVKKHGPGSGYWTLEQAGQIHVSAKKKALIRKFDMESPMGRLLLSAEMPLTRAFLLTRNDQNLARMAPVHPFTKRAEIAVEFVDYEFPTVCFSFWLAVLMWRRSASSSAS